MCITTKPYVINPLFSSWQNSVSAIFVNGFEMQALNHVCILHLIWSWVRPQGPYLHPHVKKYHILFPFLYIGIFFAYFIAPEKGNRKRSHNTKTYPKYTWWYNVLFGRDAVIYFWWWKIYNTCTWIMILYVGP